MQMIFSCEFIMDLWLFDIGERGVGESRVACELILAPVRLSFVPTIAQMLLSYWRQIKATHDIKRPIKTGTFDKLRQGDTSPLAGAGVQSDKLIMRNSMELQNVTLC